MAHIFEITDIHAPELRPYAQLTHAQLRSRRDPEQGILIAESAKVIACALNAGCRPVSFLMERRQLPAFAEQFQDRCGDVPVYTADREVLAQLTGYALTRGMLCAMRRPTLPAMDTTKPRRKLQRGRSFPRLRSRVKRAAKRGEADTITPTLEAVLKVRAMFSSR